MNTASPDLLSLVDCHAHILPGMDDGAVDQATASAMLERLAAQPIRAVVATPHYHPHRESIAAFLSRREKAAAVLRSVFMSTENLSIYYGAEVRLERGLSTQDLRPLCIGGTNRLLLELPFQPFKDWMREELWEISHSGDIVPVLAHVERYLPWYRPADYADLFHLEYCAYQVNAEAFASRRARRFLRSILEKSLPLLVGSDAHNLTTRPPDLSPVVRGLHSRRYGQALGARLQAAQEDMGI